MSKSVIRNVKTDDQRINERFYYLAKRTNGAHVFVQSDKDLKKYIGKPKKTLKTVAGDVSIVQQVDLLNILMVKTKPAKNSF